MTTGQAFEIRPATGADAGAIADVHLVSHRETYIPLIGQGAYWPIDAAERLAEWQQALAGDGIVLVAIAAGRVIGFGHAEGERIHTLYILPAWHRRGIGRALIAELCRVLAARGVALAHFAVLEVNKKAIAFYEALGARATGKALIEEHGMTYEDRLFEIATSLATP